MDLAGVTAPEWWEGPSIHILAAVPEKGPPAIPPEARVPSRSPPPRRRLARRHLTHMHLEDTYRPDLKSSASAGWRSVVLFQHEQLALAPDAGERAPVDRAGPVPVERGEVLGRRVALVAGGARRGGGARGPPPAPLARGPPVARPRPPPPAAAVRRGA